jgi:hypothetical protein
MPTDERKARAKKAGTESGKVRHNKNRERDAEIQTAYRSLVTPMRMRPQDRHLAFEKIGKRVRETYAHPDAVRIPFDAHPQQAARFLAEIYGITRQRVFQIVKSS